MEGVSKAKRRRFSARYKRRRLKEAETGTPPGEIGALLHRAGLYSSPRTKGHRPRDPGGR